MVYLMVIGLVDEVNSFRERVFLSFNIEFISEFARSYFEAEIIKKETQLNEYLNAYNTIREKESFNRQYIETLIYLLKFEINRILKIV